MSGSWPTARLGDVCDVSRGTTITRKEAVHGDVPVVAGGLEPTYFHNQANRPAGVITVSGSGANAGFVNYWSQPIFASDCSTVIPRDQSALCGRFVFFVLHAMQKFILSDLRQGAAQPHVYAKDIAQLTIPVPPFQEQRSIVRILDDVFSGISTVRANTERNLRSTVEIFECHLQSAFSRHGDAWDRRTLADLLECGWIQSHLDGNHGSDYPRKEEFIESGVPYISANCLVNDRVDMARAKYLSPARASLLRKGIAKHNDVLFAHNATVGPVALLHTEEAKVVLERVENIDGK